MKSLESLQEQLTDIRWQQVSLHNELKELDQLEQCLQDEISRHDSNIAAGIMEFIECVFSTNANSFPGVLKELEGIKAAGFRATYTGVLATYKGLAMHEMAFRYFTFNGVFEFRYSATDGGKHHTLTCLSHSEVKEDVCQEILRVGDMLEDVNEQMWNDDKELTEDEVMAVLTLIPDTKYWPVLLALGCYHDAGRYYPLHLTTRPC